MQTLYQLNEQI